MRSTKHILLGSLFVLYSFALNGQSNAIDSLKKKLQTQKEDTSKVNVLNDLGWAFIKVSSYDSALHYANRALSLAEKINFKKGQGQAYENTAWVYQTLGNYIAARNNYLSAIKVYKEFGDRLDIAWCTSRVANSYYTEGDIAEAIKISYDALKLYEELKYKPGIAYTYLLIGNFYYVDENYSESLKNFVLSLKLYEEIGSKQGVAVCKQGMGKIEAKQGNYTEALRKYSEVLKVFEEVKDNASIAETHRYMGELFETLGEKNMSTSKNNYSEALKNYFKYLSFYEAIKDKGGIVTGYHYVGKINIKLGNYRTAKIYLGNALQLAKEIGSKGDLRDTYQSFSTLDSSQGDYKQAYEHYKVYILYRDSISNEETKRKLMRATMQYDFDKKETLAKTEQIKKDAAVKRIRNLQYTAIGAFLLLALFLYWNNRQKQKAKVKIMKAYTELKTTQQQLIQSEKMASLGELTAGIAHEIQNPLNFVNNFSEVNTELISEMVDEVDKGNTEEVKAIANDIKQNLEKINHHGKRADAIVKGMLQHSRSTSGVKEPTDINKLADEYLRLSYHGLRAKDKDFNATIKTDFDESIGNVNIIPQDIGRVLLNLYNNAFYAVSEKKKQQAKNYEPTVSIKTKKLDARPDDPVGRGKIEVRVKDNGNGIPQKVIDKVFQPFFTTKPTGQGTGLGLSLSYDIVKAHGGEIKVETKEGEGSQFIIALPIQS